ncbi:MAG: carboxypeptidase-like regulatory domain-containing protein [Ignavibacteriaceae bacterium]|nr:carboxypeptidase-like regulatory domain-containing protein [Ignavibacteriaceae bacterium]
MKFLLLFLVILTQTIFSQNIHVSGKVSDSKSNAYIASANVILCHLPDSTIKGTTSDRKGAFYFSDIKSGNYSLSVKFIGYQSYNQPVTVFNKSIDVGVIKLIPGQIELDEVLIIDKVPVAIQSGDTTIYNADAFKVNKDAVAQDLLLKIPGVTGSGWQSKSPR